jgi:hypothetical protein
MATEALTAVWQALIWRWNVMDEQSKMGEPAARRSVNNMPVCWS